MKAQTAVQTTASSSSTTDSNLVLQRKCACGGPTGLSGTCEECADKLLLGRALQTKLIVGSADDPLEREADRVAEEVMRMPKPEITQSSGNTRNAPSPLHTSLVQPGSPIPHRSQQEAPSAVNDVLRSSGQPLGAAERQFFEPRLRQDFSQVRVHSNAMAGVSAGAMQARAYTVGRHIVFGAGQFAPDTRRGQRLLAHELVHVAQQQRGRAPVSVQRAPVATTAEASAAAPVAGSGAQKVRVTIYSGDPDDPQGETAKGIAEKRYRTNATDLVVPIQKIEDIHEALQLYAYFNRLVPVERSEQWKREGGFLLVPADHPGFVREISIIGHGNAATKKSEPFYGFGGVAYTTSELSTLHANGLDLSRYLTNGASVVLEGCKAAKGPEGRKFLCEVGKIFLGGHKRGRVQGNTNESIGFADEIMGGNAQVMKWPDDCAGAGITCDPLLNTPSGFACFPEPGGDGFQLVKTE